jgi:hypothetical protein
MVSSENNDGGFTKYSRQRVDDKKLVTTGQSRIEKHRSTDQPA